MALGSYNRSHQRQSYYYHLADTRIYINGLDFQSTLGNLTLATSIEALSVNGLDFETTVGDLNIRTNLILNGMDFLSAIGNVDVTETFSRCYIGHDASSFFISKNLSTNPSSIIRKFTFANSDLTDRITKFPIIRRQYKNVIAQPFTMELENASQLMNELIEDKTKFRQDGDIQYGYQANPTSADVLCLGGGSLITANYNNSTVRLTFKNRMDILAETKISLDTTSKTGVTYVGSEYNPADIVWDILTSTSFGAQFNTVGSYTNAEIHYDSWLQWKANLASENLTINGFFGADASYQKALQSIAEVTDSAIYVEADNRLYFVRNLVGVQSFAGTVLDSDIISMTTNGDANDMCNEYIVPTSYAVADNDVSAEPHARLAHINAASVNSFGKVSKEVTTKLVWYTNSANANNLAQRVVARRREPEIAVKVKTPIKYLQQQLGDLIYITASDVGLSAEPYTMVGQSIDVENNTMDLDLSIGHGIAVANMSVFTLGDTTLGTLDNTVGLLA
tara:strand:+ start:2138 stop:3658 length:1521 start_codon:yes stop_codon:yes gene_type:complete